MGGYVSSGVVTSDAETQTEEEGGGGSKRKGKGGKREFPVEIQQFTSVEIQEMVLLYKERQHAVDRTSIRGVQSKKDLYDALSMRGDKGEKAARPQLNPNTLHRQNHPKGYLTKVTNDYEAQHDEELSVHRGTMVKVLRNHGDGRHEVYTAGGFGLVPGKILAYIQYEPDLQ